jgi:DNA-binding CsgD family transcriptional regulator
MNGRVASIFPPELSRSPELIGRDADLAALRFFAGQLPARGDALLLSGEPGGGKSALLGVAGRIAAGAGIRVLRAADAEFEDLSFSALNQFLLPLRGELPGLDRSQRDALSVALGFSDGPAPDRLVVSNAALALLCRGAADRPLLLTAHEHQIAALAAGGLTNKQIGQRLFLSPRTVSGHLYRVFPKLGVASRAGLRDALNAFDSRAAA